MLLKACTFLIAVSLAACAKPPVWAPSYAVGGVLQLPYAEINEPFMAYYDSTANKSRIDYYGGLMKTYQIGVSKASFGSNKKVVYASYDKVYNKLQCFKADGDKENPVAIQAVLPDLTGFTAVPGETYKTAECNVWQKIEMKGQKKNVYKMYVVKKSGKPLRYEMYGYDSLLGSHYDKYYVDYENYNPQKIDPKLFEIKGMNCTGFPGPGAESGVLMNPMREYMNNDDAHVHTMFDHFKRMHNKKYANQQEHQERKNVFRQNVRFIHSKNRATLGFSLAVNHLADWSDKELLMLRGRKHSTGYNGGLPFNKAAYSGALPNSVDWRLYGAVTPVKDQAVCGSCWSFGSSGAVEGAYFLKMGMLVRLSQQELMDCSWGEGNNACDGGEDFRSYQWIMKNGGLTSEEQYGPYLAADSKCTAQNVTGVAKITGYVNVTSGDLEALRMALAQHGPISVSIDASHKSLSFYANGVYYEPDCKSDPDGLDHSVLAVGYGFMNGKPYWLIKNSWSTYWGNDGYVLMSQKDNNCGVATAPTYVLM